MSWSSFVENFGFEKLRLLLEVITELANGLDGISVGIDEIIADVRISKHKIIESQVRAALVVFRTIRFVDFNEGSVLVQPTRRLIAWSRYESQRRSAELRNLLGDTTSQSTFDSDSGQFSSHTTKNSDKLINAIIWFAKLGKRLLTAIGDFLYLILLIPVTVVYRGSTVLIPRLIQLFRSLAKFIIQIFNAILIAIRIPFDFANNKIFRPALKTIEQSDTFALLTFIVLIVIIIVIVIILKQ